MKTKEGKRQVNIEFDEEQFEILDNLAKQYRISRSAVLKIALAHLERNNLLIPCQQP